MHTSRWHVGGRESFPSQTTDAFTAFNSRRVGWLEGRGVFEKWPF